MPGTEVFSYVSKLLATNVSVTEAVADLATEISPLPQTKIGKKANKLPKTSDCFCQLLVVRQNFFRIIFYNNLFKTTFQKQSSSKVAKNLDRKSRNFRVFPQRQNCLPPTFPY
jgi:hypothetical protein